MSQVELETFDECLAYLPEGVRDLQSQLTDDFDDEDKKAHVAQVFLPITFMLNHGKITVSQAEQFRELYVQLTDHQVEFVKEEDGQWRLRQ